MLYSVYKEQVTKHYSGEKLKKLEAEFFLSKVKERNRSKRSTINIVKFGVEMYRDEDGWGDPIIRIEGVSVLYSDLDDFLNSIKFCVEKLKKEQLGGE